MPITDARCSRVTLSPIAAHMRLPSTVHTDASAAVQQAAEVVRAVLRKPHSRTGVPSAAVHRICRLRPSVRVMAKELVPVRVTVHGSVGAVSALGGPRSRWARVVMSTPGQGEVR